MRLRMTFNVGGILRLADHFPIESDGIQLTLRTEGDKVTHVICECDIAKTSQHPSITSRNDKTHLNVSCDEIGVILEKLRLLQGSYAPFGDIGLDFLNPQMDWINELNEDPPRIMNLSINRSNKGKVLATEFHDLALCFIESGKFTQFNIELNLFRRAIEEIGRKNFILAYMFFFLMLERCFGNGQFKKHALVSAFHNSEQLTKHLQAARNDFLKRHDIDHTSFYKAINCTEIPKQLIAKIIERRGHLFHNTRKGDNNWSPEKQEDFRAEATFLHMLCLKIAIEIISPAHTPEANQRYRDQAAAIGARIMLTVQFQFIDEDEKKQTETIHIKMTGTKPTNFGIREAVNIAIEHFEDQIESSQLEKISICTEDGRTLASLEIHAEN